MRTKRLLISAAIFFSIIGGALLDYGLTYHHRYYPGVKIGQVNLSGKTPEQAKAALANQVATYLSHPIILTIPDISKERDVATNRYPNLQISATGKDLGLTFNQDKALADAWNVGHTRNFLTWLKTAPKVFVQGSSQTLAYRADSTTIQTFIHTQVTPKIITPTPAKIVVADAVVRVDPPKPGLEINEPLLVTALARSMEDSTDADPTYVQVPTTQIDSSVTARMVQPYADTLNQVGNAKVSLTGDGVSLSPTRAQLLSWFLPAQSEKGDLSLAFQKQAFAQYLAPNTLIDQASAVDQLAPKIEALATTPVATLALAVPTKPKQVVKPGSYTLSKYEGKYVEVNLADQRLYLINGSNLEKTYIVSTGAWNTPTPVGEYKIGAKSVRAWSAPYGLYMPYWQSFLNDEYGLHELPEWPNGYKEGANHLGVPVSHGCVRLGVGDAKEVYDWTTTGTPVYIH
jgi:lipoprotein-anchoring transpeptidase ErfK/SrfK